MKVGIWVDNEYDPKSGGSFSYTDAFLKAIDKFSFSEKIEVCFVGFNLQKKEFHKEAISINLPSDSSVFHWRIIRKFLKWIPGVDKKMHQLLNQHFIKKLTSQNVKLIFYPIHMQCVVSDFPFIATYWDLGHLSMPSFPEVAMYNNFDSRDNWFDGNIKKALAIFSETNAGKKEMGKYLSIYEPNKIKVMPIFPGAVVELNVSFSLQKEYLERNKLIKNKYFFYPAQFWAHKNHFNLIEGFELLLKKHPNAKLVLCGSDKGNLTYIKRIIEKKNISESILLTGFISNEEVFTLYSNAAALVMPTFLGPSNMPLLEAMYIGCPVICSDLEGHKEIMKQSGLYVDPTNKQDLEGKMAMLLSEEIRAHYVTLIAKEKEDTSFSVEMAVMAFEKNLIELIPIRNCWE